MKGAVLHLIDDTILYDFLRKFESVTIGELKYLKYNNNNNNNKEKHFDMYKE